MKPKALSGSDHVVTEFEADYDSYYLSEKLSDRRLKWPDYNLRPKFINSIMDSRENSPSPKTFSPTMLANRPEFIYPQRKMLEREFPVMIEAECKTTYTNHDSKQLPDARISSKKDTAATEGLTTASPSKSPTKSKKEKPKVSKNPFHKEKDKDKIKQAQSTANISPSRANKYKNAVEGWDTPAVDYKFPPSKPKLPTVGEIKPGMSNYSIVTEHLKNGNPDTSLYGIHEGNSHKNENQK